MFVWWWIRRRRRSRGEVWGRRSRCGMWRGIVRFRVLVVRREVGRSGWEVVFVKVRVWLEIRERVWRRFMRWVVLWWWRYVLWWVLVVWLVVVKMRVRGVWWFCGRWKEIVGRVRRWWWRWDICWIIVVRIVMKFGRR